MNVTLLPELAFAFMLVFARIAMIVQLMPAIGAATVPSRVRLAIALLLTLLLVPLLSDKLPDIPSTPFGLAFLIAGEIIVGFFIGGVATMITSALQTAGASIAFQTSLSAAQNTDLATAIQGTLISSFLSVVSLALIFAMNIHHLIIAVIHDSYSLFKPGDLMPVGDLAKSAIDLFADAFALGIQLSAPFILIGFVFNVGVGILSRLMPQFQVFLVLLPANIMLGFLGLFALLSTMMIWYIDHLRDGLSVFLVQ